MLAKVGKKSMIENIAYDVVSGLMWPGQRMTPQVRIGPRSPRQFATERAGIAHIRRSLIAEFARGLAIWSVVGGKDDDACCLDAEFLERVENPADVIVALHQLVAVVADPRLALELLRGQVRDVSHREWQVEKEGLCRRPSAAA